MKILLPLLALVITCSLFGQDERKVLLVGIDGVRSDALQLASTPNIDGLIATGIYSPDALNDDITISGPGWSAILCGVRSDKHLVVNNNFSGNNYEQYPSFIQRMEEHNPDFHTASFCHWSPINDNIIAESADFKLNFGTDAEVATQAAAYVSTNDPDALFLHFDEPDHVGHGSGFSPDNPAYVTSLEVIDEQVGEVLEAIRSRVNYDSEDWLILVTTDHGGLGTSHGGNSFAEQNVFFIASGKNVEPEVIRRDSTYEDNSEIDCLEHEASLYFSGDGSQVQIPTHSDFSFGAARDFSIECRVRTTSSGDVAIVGNKDWDSGNNAGFIFSFKYPSGPEWKINIGDGTNRADLNVGGLIADNEWHTLTGTFDRDGFVRMYEDGVLVASTDISFVGSIDTEVGLLFGSDIEEAYPYSGYLSEVRVWEGVLEADVISDWHCQSLSEAHPAYDQLLGYWPMAQAVADDQILDESGNMQHGVNTGATWQTADSVLVEDFSGTPRLVDVPVTALQHLCIPIQTEWNLDGQSLIPACTINDLEEPLADWDVRLTPNPLRNGQALSLVGIDHDQVASLSLFAADGRFLRDINNDTLLSGGTIALGVLEPGVYILRIENDAGQAKSLKVTVL